MDELRDTLETISKLMVELAEDGFSSRFKGQDSFRDFSEEIGQLFLIRPMRRKTPPRIRAPPILITCSGPKKSVTDSKDWQYPLEQDLSTKLFDPTL